MGKSYKLTPEQRAKFLEKEEQIVDTYKKMQLYGEYVSIQRSGFEKIMNLINDWINELKENGNISEYIEIRARIKAIESAIYNDEKKALDDVFGMEVIAATEDELQIIIDKILENFEVIRQKNHDKDNGYKAQHKLIMLKQDECIELGISEEEMHNMPLLEIQFKTLEVAIRSSVGSADHSSYKGETKEGVQSKYDANGFKKSINVPTMWISKDGKMIEISLEETLKKMYPFLKLNNTKKEVEK